MFALSKARIVFVEIGTNIMDAWNSFPYKKELFFV